MSSRYAAPQTWGPNLWCSSGTIGGPCAGTTLHAFGRAPPDVLAGWCQKQRAAALQRDQAIRWTAQRLARARTPLLYVYVNAPTGVPAFQSFPYFSEYLGLPDDATS